MTTDGSMSEELDVLVIGAGFTGVYQLDRLRSLGFSVKIYEAGSGMGGVWYWNCYPGARVDSEGTIYQFAHKDLWRDWEFTELYPGSRELCDYFGYLDRTLDLSRDIRFDTRVVGADFDTESGRWVVRTEDGRTARCRYLVPCLGIASKPYVPAIAGLDSFRGICHHTARWPQEGVDLTGRRVAVIGTGASGVQTIQEAARVAADVTVFQRTPNMALPMGQRALSGPDWAAIREGLPERLATREFTFAGFDYEYEDRNAVDVTAAERDALYEKLWAAGGFRFWLAIFQDTMFDERANDHAYAFWRDKVRARIHDPELAEKLAPTVAPHPFGAKRPSLEQDYYDVVNQPNVHLVDIAENPIGEITPTGVRTADGTHREFDVIVLATGFDAVSGGLTQIDLRGTGGTLLRDHWADGVTAHLGIATAGFPNMLFVYGPLAPSGFCNGPTCSELQGEMIVDLLRHLSGNGLRRIESTPEADHEWAAHVDSLTEQTLFPRAESWYLGANIPGKPRQMLNYPGGLPQYRAKFAEMKADGLSGFVVS